MPESSDGEAPYEKSDHAGAPAACIEVPHTALAPELLQAVIESFVLREGTDYGAREFSLQEKVAHVIRQLERGEAKITFDPETETISLILA